MLLIWHKKNHYHFFGQISWINLLQRRRSSMYIIVQALEIALEMWLWSPEVSFKDKALLKICFGEEFRTVLHFLHCKFILRKYLKDFSELVLTYVRPSKKCKDFMKNFPKHFDPIFGLAVAVELGDRKAGYEGGYIF